MKIFGLIQRNSGPGFHRIMMPLLLMPDADVYITNAIEEKDFAERKPDWIYYNRFVSDDVLKACKTHGVKVALDIDDYWHLDPHHISFKESVRLDLPRLQKWHMMMADVVTCTNDRLAEVIYPFNKNVVILPNAIPQHEYFPVIKTPHPKHRIFWQGSITHEPDIKLLAKTMKQLQPDKFLAVMAGYTPHVAWQRMGKVFTEWDKKSGVILDGLPPHQYYQNYQYADVCVIPLLSSKFNSYKSNLKVLEAAHSDLPVIASNVHPYKNMPLLYVNKESDWLKWLNDFDAQKENAVQLAEYCRKNHDYQIINQIRKGVFYDNISQ